MHRQQPMLSSRGFSLIEVLIATTIVATALAVFAQLVAMAAAANAAARSTTMATMLAVQKVEELRSLAWGIEGNGLPVSDPGLAASPSGSLRNNRAGFCDFLDGSGRSLGDGTAPPAGAVYLRRWSIEPLPADPNNVLVLQVLVTQRFSRDIDAQANRHIPDEARIITIKTRKGV